MDSVTATLEGHFTKSLPVTYLEDDIQTISMLIANAPSLVYRNKDPARTRTEIHKYRDATDTGHDGLSDKPREIGEGRAFQEEVISVIKTAEIAGVLLTNQFANLSRSKKNASIKIVFDSLLRLVREFYRMFERDQERLIQELTGRAKLKRESITLEEAESEARFAVAWILRAISAGLVLRAGCNLTSADLRDNVEEVVSANPTPAMQLVQLGQLLDGPGPLPRYALNKIIRDESDNPCVMSVLQLLILKRLYMYETKHDDKHWAISTFQLMGTNPKIEAANKRPQLEGRSPA